MEGTLPFGVTAKDIVLAVIGKIGTAGGNGHALEFAGSAIRALSMEGRMTICNMSIEAGARVGMVAVDEKTIAYVKGRPFAPKGADWDAAVALWSTLVSDPDAHFDTVVELHAEDIKPQVSWGTSPEMVLAIDQHVPDPATEQDPTKRNSIERALKYMGLKANQAITDIRLDRVFIGSCTNSRIEDPARGRRSGQGTQGRVNHQAGAGGAGFWLGQGAGRGGRPGQGVPGCRFRMARAGLLDVSGHESGQARQRRALRFHLQPQLRRPPGRRWPHAFGQPGDGRCSSGERAFCRCA